MYLQLLYPLDKIPEFRIKRIRGVVHLFKLCIGRNLKGYRKINAIFTAAT